MAKKPEVLDIAKTTDAKILHLWNSAAKAKDVFDMFGLADEKKYLLTTRINALRKANFPVKSFRGNAVQVTSTMQEYLKLTGLTEKELEAQMEEQRKENEKKNKEKKAAQSK